MPNPAVGDRIHSTMHNLGQTCDRATTFESRTLTIQATGVCYCLSSTHKRPLLEM